jgi:VWFA-related protein
MRRLARMTGGEVFFLARDAGLKKVYDQIDRELRTQYVLAYTSNAETVSDAFRKVTVNVKRPGVEVRTIAGYYPGE